jgi:type VI protein secretion system component VasK
MRIDNILTAATDQLLWPLLRRALLVLAFAILAMIAVYHLTIAGNIALAHRFGDLNARLIIGAIYAALALLSLIVLWAMRGKPAKLADTPALQRVRETHLVMLVEAAMLGYTLARKGQRTR